MNRAQLKVLSHVLGIASNEFSNHGCNDLRLDKLGLTEEELKIFRDDFTRYMQADDPQYDHHGNCVQDDFVMSYLRDEALKEIEATLPCLP